MTNQPMMTCAEVDGTLLDYLEDTLDRETRSSVDQHVASCVRCSAIMRDIAAIRSKADRLPELAPSRDLWQGISERIAPAVLPLSVPSRSVTPRRWIPLAAAAAVLVIGTAGITYLATSRSLAPSPATVAAVARPAPIVSESAVAKVPDATQSVSPGTESVAGATEAQAPAPAETLQTGQSPTALASRPSRTPASPSDIAYGDEIQRLQNIITERRRELDPATVTVIEESLEIIDAAVRQSRAALARDPRSGFLVDQLNSALDKKVELLRTVALLPSRT